MFDHPYGIVCLDKIILVSDTYNHRIRVIDQETEEVTTLCGLGDPGHIDGACTQTKFNIPKRLALNLTSEYKALFVTELNDCVRVIDL